jgi:hypothetical protein
MSRVIPPFNISISSSDPVDQWTTGGPLDGCFITPPSPSPHGWGRVRVGGICIDRDHPVDPRKGLTPLEIPKSFRTPTPRLQFRPSPPHRHQKWPCWRSSFCYFFPRKTAKPGVHRHIAKGSNPPTVFPQNKPQKSANRTYTHPHSFAPPMHTRFLRAPGGSSGGPVDNGLSTGWLLHNSFGYRHLHRPRPSSGPVDRLRGG